MGSGRDARQTVRGEYERLARFSGSPGDHNRFYYNALLAQIPEHVGRVLDVGCGAGEFSHRLAGRAEYVLGLDRSPEMIKRALRDTADCPCLDFAVGDVLEYPLEEGVWDVVAAVAVLHDLPWTAFLERVPRLLRPGGVFLALDCYRATTWTDRLCSAVATVADWGVRRMYPIWGVSEEEGDFWHHRGVSNRCVPFETLRHLVGRYLPGVRLRRHLFWRYSLVWRKPQVGEKARF